MSLKTNGLCFSNFGSLFVPVYFLLEVSKPLPFYFVNRFKNNGENFQVLLSGQNNDVSVVSSGKTFGAEISDVNVPEELVQIQAYLRWERKGKQMYTPEQEKASVFFFLLILQ